MSERIPTIGDVLDVEGQRVKINDAETSLPSGETVCYFKIELNNGDKWDIRRSSTNMTYIGERPIKHRDGTTTERSLWAYNGQLFPTMSLPGTTSSEEVDSFVPQLAEFSSLSQWASELGVSRSLAYHWFKQGRIHGAVMLGRDIMVPSGSVRPEKRKPGRKKK